MTKIETITKWLKEPESKKILAPKTLTSCVYDENGETVETRLNKVFQSVSNGKSLIASAITDKGITTAADATFQTMADNILKIISRSSEDIIWHKITTTNDDGKLVVKQPKGILFTCANYPQQSGHIFTITGLIYNNYGARFVYDDNNQITYNWWAGDLTAGGIGTWSNGDYILETSLDGFYAEISIDKILIDFNKNNDNNLNIVKGDNFRTGISMNVTLNFQEVTWNVTTDPNPSVSASFGEAITTNWNGGDYIGINIFTVYPIDLTNIKSIKIKYTESAHYGDTFPFWLGITSTKYMTVVDPRYIAFDKKVSNTATGETEITMDVSDINGKKYIYIMPIGYTCTITDLILEKKVDTRFEIKNPDLLQKVKVCSVGGRDYYAYSSVIPTSYWAIGLLATTTEGFTVPIIVSDVPEQASASTSYAPTTVWGDILNFEYNGKTYYCNSGIYGAEVGPAIDNIIPIYNGAAFANTKDGWLSMAKKLLDFYFGKEEFPSET